MAMPLTYIGDDDFPMVFSFARLASNDEVGTEHLLHGLVRAVPKVAHLLDAFDVTPLVVQSVLKDRAGRWGGPEGGPRDQNRDSVVIAEGGTPAPFSAAARAALVRAQERECPPGSAHLLAAILDDPESRAITMLRDCAVDVEQVRMALQTGQTPERAERVEPELRLMRDRLIGRERYRGRGLHNILMSFIVRVRINYARTPVLWASLEADEIARGRGGATRTDDILVAMLRAYAVAKAYPHLWRAVPEQYVGVRNLVEGGLDYRSAAKTAAESDLGEDAVPPRSLLKRGEQWPKDTTSLLRLLRGCSGNRSAQVLEKQGIA
jgi:hypothetical protein